MYAIRSYYVPALAKALIAACAPGPGLLCLFPPGALTRMWMPLMPLSLSWSASWPAICMAVYGELSSLAAFTTIPPEDFAMVSAPVMSVTVMIVLLNEDLM